MQRLCKNCQKAFRIIEQEKLFLDEKGLPLPEACPTCRQVQRLHLRGDRTLFKTNCQKCGNEIVVSYDPKTVSNLILCKKDYDAYFEENDPIITEPLPES